MERRQLGDSGLEATVIGLGSWAIGGWLWGGAEDAESVPAIRRAIELGINFVDTAPIYGQGRSEELVGRALEGIRDQVVLATKCGLVWGDRPGRDKYVQNKGLGIRRNLEPDSVTRECEDSLRRLRTDVIDLYQCHWPDIGGPPIADTMSALVKLQEQGKIRSIGVSNHSVDQIQESMKHGRIVSDQPQYNMLDRSIEADVLPFCRRNNIGVIAYSPLGRGILTGRVTMDREFNEGDHRAGLPWYQRPNRKRVLAFLEKVRPIADGHGATLAQLAANWVICQRGVTTAICGARTAGQVEENVRAGGFRLSKSELAEIRMLLDELGEPTKG